MKITSIGQGSCTQDAIVALPDISYDSDTACDLIIAPLTKIVEMCEIVCNWLSEDERTCTSN